MSAQPASKRRSPAVVAATLTVAGLAQVFSMAAPHIKHWEGLRQSPYRDIVDVLTVCYGHTGRDIVPGKTYTLPECDRLLTKDMKTHFAAVQRCITSPVPVEVLAALLVGTINLGPALVCGSTLQRYMNAGQLNQGCGQLLRWVYAGGRRVQGLVNRRQLEYKLCMLGVQGRYL